MDYYHHANVYYIPYAVAFEAYVRHESRTGGQYLAGESSARNKSDCFKLRLMVWGAAEIYCLRFNSRPFRERAPFVLAGLTLRIC